MRILMILFLFLSILLFSSACSESLEPIEQLELTINPIPSELDTNIPKISGSVTNPNSNVSVNGVNAMVLEDGSFFVYIEIPPRKPTKIEVRAESSGHSVSKSFDTVFYPEPFIGISNTIDTRSDPAKMEGWVSYPDSNIEITGNLKNPVVNIQENGFFTAAFSLSEGYIQSGDERVHYDVKVNAITPRGTTTGTNMLGITMNSAPNPIFPLNDTPVKTIKVNVEKGKTVLFDREYSHYVFTPMTIDLNLVPDPKSRAVSENLEVDIEPKSFLGYPGAPRISTIIIKVNEGVPSGSYFFRANRGDHIEVIVK